MDTHEKKISLLCEMIAFSIVDGKLHEREYQFLALIAAELKIAKDEFQDLFHREHDIIPIEFENQRIQQFYRLALLMHVDGILHEKEVVTIKQIAIEMGLNPSATSRCLDLMRSRKKQILEPKEVYALFTEQQN